MYEIMRTSTSIDALSKSSARLVEFTDMMDKIRQTHKKPSEILGALFEETGYHAMLKAEGEISAARIDSVNEFITAAIEYESRTEEALPTLL